MKHLTAMKKRGGLSVGAKRTQQGFSLIEVLIVFFVLSVGLLGMAALQMKSMQYNQSSYIRSQATVAAYDMLDRMRANRAVAVAGGYNVAYANTTSAGPGAVERADVLEWATFLATTLPTGQGQIVCNNPMCVITIQWADRVTGNLGANTLSSLSITAQL